MSSSPLAPPSFSTTASPYTPTRNPHALASSMPRTSSSRVHKSPLVMLERHRATACQLLVDEHCQEDHHRKEQHRAGDHTVVWWTLTAQPAVVLYSMLWRVKNSFSTSTKLRHGGFGSVHKAMLPLGQMVALKVMDSPGLLQREREFHNEFNLCSNLKSLFVVLFLGFSSNRRNQKLVLVYELMPNRELCA
ncbi:hypothetical protein Fmac_025023 [Flemingia macrophylla]|uniref:Protein kinase domain-containing protein n=1 Tax=Flemingia macrophylla TaxID=520843 RepID=A0ABD1LR14_9FABA